VRGHIACRGEQDHDGLLERLGPGKKDMAMNSYLLFLFGGHELNHVIGLNRASADLINVYAIWSPSPVIFLNF
jgi:hypothetical protein